ncbi:MAG: molybdopterin-guanine dinucleotide biosynthesis protein B [Magnetospiraceae bacterium]
MKVFGIVGPSGSGKTTLVEGVLPILRARGWVVSTMKHTHKGFDMDRPGKDSHRHRAAGSHEVMVVGPQGWAMLHDYPNAQETPVDALIDRMAPVDLLLIEGFKAHSHPKIEVHRPAHGKPRVMDTAENLVAVASDVTLEGSPFPVLDLDDWEAVADFILNHAGLQRAAQ